MIVPDARKHLAKLHKSTDSPKAMNSPKMSGFHNALGVKHSASRSLMKLESRSYRMNSYPQELSTGGDTLWETPGITLNYCTYLTPSVRSKHAGEPSGVARKARFVLLAGLCVTLITANLNHSYAKSYSIDQLKLYAHTRLLDFKEFQCFNKIITKESKWSYTARNKSHYGLGQMRSKHYGTLDPYRQIDRTIAYITHRYTTPCEAWSFHQRNNWF